MDDEVMATEAETPTNRRRLPVATRGELEQVRTQIAEHVAHLNQRIDDEINGLTSDILRSVRDEVTRLDRLIVEVSERLDAYIADADRAVSMSEALDLRLREAVELSGQHRSAERLIARRFSEIEQRLGDLEGGRSDREATSP